MGVLDLSGQARKEYIREKARKKVEEKLRKRLNLRNV